MLKMSCQVPSSAFCAYKVQTEKLQQKHGLDIHKRLDISNDQFFARYNIETLKYH